jgi:hypothetical protein
MRRMNVETILQLNVVPEGKEAWLSYDQYLELNRLFDRVSPFETEVNGEAFRLYDFLTTTAKLNVPITVKSIHFNAFVLIRRGYKVEEITEKEYQDLVRLMDGLEQPDPDDMELHEFGGHRNLYAYLTTKWEFRCRQGVGRCGRGRSGW